MTKLQYKDLVMEFPLLLGEKTNIASFPSPPSPKPGLVSEIYRTILRDSFYQMFETHGLPPKGRLVLYEGRIMSTELLASRRGHMAISVMYPNESEPGFGTHVFRTRNLERLSKFLLENNRHKGSELASSPVLLVCMSTNTENYMRNRDEIERKEKERSFRKKAPSPIELAALNARLKESREISPRDFCMSGEIWENYFKPQLINLGLRE